MPRNIEPQRARRLARIDSLFTDRVPESVAFSTALSAHREYMDATEAAPGARNLLVYFGMGGIGKTTLSQRLEKWSSCELMANDYWGPPPSTTIAATCRIDLHNTQGQVDMVAALISLRRAFGKAKKKWPAFDLALSTYWETVNPNTPLPGAGTNDSSVADGITDSLNEIFSDLGIPLTGITARGIRMATNAIRTRTTRRNLFENYDEFEDLLERCAQLPTPDDPHPELLCEIAALLNSELSTWSEPQAPMFVAFIDTYERLLGDPRRAGEAALNELIWQLPNVLFVATGRNAVDWHDTRRTNLYISGPKAWPGLVPGTSVDPRQHLVGRLAPEDRLAIIRHQRDLHKVEISDAVMHELAEASDGLPLYLELAFTLADMRKMARAAPISVKDVSGALDDLVLRVLEDVPVDEQRALRAASLFPFYDSHLIAATAAVDDGCARRALTRAMHDLRGTKTFPYSMHDAVRLAIRNSDHSVSNGWSEADWRTAGERALVSLQQKYEYAAAAKEIEPALDTLTLAIELISTQELTIGSGDDEGFDDWLCQAVAFGPSAAALLSTLPERVTTATGQGIVDFVNARSPACDVDLAVKLLTDVFESDHSLRLSAGRHCGYALRNANRWDEAIATFNELVSISPKPIHLHQRALTLLSARRFAEAVDDTRYLSDAPASRIRENCALSHGKFGDHLEKQALLLPNLWDRNRHREAFSKQALIYKWQAFISGEVDLKELQIFCDQAEKAQNAAAVTDAYLARVFVDPKTLVDLPDERARVEKIDNKRSPETINFRTGLVRLAFALYTGDEEGLAELATHLRERRQPRSRQWIPIECVLDSYGYDVDPPATQWLEPYPIVRDRWRAHFDTWIARVRNDDVTNHEV